MYLFLIFWLLFLLIYSVFNVYGIYRVIKMRIKGDKIPLAILVYLIFIGAVIFITFTITSQLDWGKNLPELLHL
ncbi:MAG: hypothetical protein US94_C0005G0017 [Berkelbacteria bacterium GW2011_GWB1_38_5]|uniref:Uncharacterized protein n=1 Tax=Berkelbacteria bacterium GW2011_GWB1_38_5 TaxID=1618336 RepID=A0A0G0NBD0_9BACT|nr:MAG: hypothetical protein US94_C0005G0017 [Berkelbacteria bacterium GW2011_GWB1_38_5]